MLDKTNNAVEQFATAMEAQGYGHHVIPADGDWHNIAFPGRKKTNGSARLSILDGKPDGVVKDFRDKQLWTWSGNQIELTDAEREALNSNASQAAAKKKADQEQARKDAFDLFHNSGLTAAPIDHPYLVKKGIKDATPLKYEKSSKALVCPIFNARTNQFQTIERIYEDGKKLVPKNAIVECGCSIPGNSFPELADLDRGKGNELVLIGEGWATMLAVRVSTRQVAVSARYSQNIKLVAKALRDRYPMRPFIICGDNGNGSADAIDAGRVIGARVAFPAKGYKDFDDMRRAEGPEVVAGAINNAKEPPPEVKSSLITVRASDVVMRPKDWLWHGHLLRGSLELLAGTPGLGKSQVHCDMVARVSAGLPWPDAKEGRPPASVLMISAEDSSNQEIVPRLVAAGANLERIHIIKCIKTDKKNRQFLLAEDLDDVERKLKELHDVVLMTIDPITAYMGGKMDSHKTTEVRSQLGPLKEFSEKTNVALSAITHPPKNASQRAIDHFIGSQAFIAAARIGHVCIKEMVPDDSEDDEGGRGKRKMIETGRVLFCHAKHNPSVKMPTLAYTIKGLIVDKNEVTGECIEAPRVVWEKDSVNITADEAVAAASSGAKREDGRRQEQDAVQKFLLDALKGGEQIPVKQIEEEGAKRGFTKNQLDYAADKLKVSTGKMGVKDGWGWRLVSKGAL